MVSSYFRKRLSKDKPPFLIDALRLKILTLTLFVFLIIGVGLFIFSLPVRLQNQDWGILTLLVLFLVWTMVVTFVNQIKYSIRAVSLLFVITFFSIVALVTDELFWSGLVYLFAFPLVTSLVCRAPRSYFAFGGMVVLFFATVFLMENGVIHYPSWILRPGSSPLNAWLYAGASLALVSIAVTYSLISVMRELEAGVERAKKLSEDLEIERARQDHKILQSSQEYERQLAQMRYSLEIARTIGFSRFPDQFLPRAIELIQELFDFYYVGVYLLDESKSYAYLVTGTGEAGKAMLEAGHNLVINETTAVGWSINHQQARVAVDVGFEAVRFNNPLLPLTRSELALPLILRSERQMLKNPGPGLPGLESSRVFGALTVQSTEAKAFNQDDISTLQGIADMLADALENANAFQELEKNLHDIQELHRQYLRESWREVSQEGQIGWYSVNANRASVPDAAGSDALTKHRLPLKLRDVEIGQITLELEKPDLGEDEKIFIAEVTNQAALALENVRLLEKNQRQAGYERLLSDISRKVSGSTDLETILRITIQEIGSVMGATDGVIRLEIPQVEEEVKL